MSCTTTIEQKYESFMTIAQATFFASSCNKVTWLLLENVQYPSLLSKPGSYLGFVQFLVILQDSYFSVGKSSRIFPQQYYSLIPMQASLKPFSSQHFDAHTFCFMISIPGIHGYHHSLTQKVANNIIPQSFIYLVDCCRRNTFPSTCLKPTLKLNFFPCFSQIECLFVKMTQAESSTMFVANGWQVQKVHTMQVY
jgi:hypothetical protein